MSGVQVSMCVCHRRPFAELLSEARAGAWDLETLMRRTGCGTSCGLCRPYLRRMLATGETIFSELLTDESR
jgi:bacterioferritin-associated ferredoxin